MHYYYPLKSALWSIIFMLMSSFYRLLFAQSQAIIPLPNKVLFQNGYAALPSATVLNYNSATLAENALYLSQKLSEYGVAVDVKANQKNVSGYAVSLEINPKKFNDAEAYSLKITTNSILIMAAHAKGVFYGIQTLLQIIFDAHTQGRSLSLPMVEIEDGPKYAWRGMHLDVSRHFFDKDYIKKYIDLMAYLKLNVFHWHLTDDQGWRIESKKYPLLTKVGAWRNDYTHLPWRYFQYASTQGYPQYGGYYTHDDVKEIVAYAKARHIEVLPEIDLPGHSAAAIYAYPWLSCNGETWKMEIDTANTIFSDPLCVCNPKVMQFSKDILEEVMELFPFEYFHIGGDECKHKAWLGVQACEDLMKRENLKSDLEIQGWYTRELEKFVMAKGKKMIGWDEILESGTGPNAVVMSWRGFGGAIEAAKKKHYFVNASSTHLYFDMKQDDSEQISDWIKLLPLDKVYSLNPMPEELNADEQKFMLGVQACMWTEYTPTIKRLEQQILPRMAALAEVAWTNPSLKNFDDFNQRLQTHYQWLKKTTTIFLFHRLMVCSIQTYFIVQLRLI